jgi:hypothetical protein
MIIPNHIASNLAHYLAIAVVQAMASQDAAQETFEMDPTSLLGWWADRLTRAMAGTVYGPAAVRGQRRRRTYISDKLARQILSGTRPHTKALYSRGRRRGQSPRAALDRALRTLTHGDTHD